MYINNCIYIRWENMDKFSHDLTLALEETSMIDKARIGKWGQRRRTRSTGNLPCAPQPTEDSSSSPADISYQLSVNSNMGSFTTSKQNQSDSDEKNGKVRFLYNAVKKSFRLGTIESDSVNENYSPARFFKPNTRRKRKFKRMSIEGDQSMHCEYLESSNIIGKRALKSEVYKSSILFSGKRKRTNKDRYFEKAQLQSSSMPRQNFTLPFNNALDQFRRRPQCLSSTRQQYYGPILPLNKGLVSKIERMSRLETNSSCQIADLNMIQSENEVSNIKSDPEVGSAESTNSYRYKKTLLCKRKCNKPKNDAFKCQLSFDEQISMECVDLYDFSSSSSLSSSGSDCGQRNDTDREGDDELTDWPGNESTVFSDARNDLKRKLTKRSQPFSLKSEETENIADDSTHITFHDCKVNIKNALLAMEKKVFLTTFDSFWDKEIVPLKHIESEMSGETSNTFLSSPPCSLTEVREIRAGCRRIIERPGFSIKTSVNERLARFLQDATQSQIRLPEMEVYEHESLLNLSKLYSLNMSVDKGCAVLTKTSKTTQSIHIDYRNLQAHLFLSDYKRRCYDGRGSILSKK